ncbi:MAG: amidohydrolase family protein [Planctomycetota bacterium]
MQDSLRRLLALATCAAMSAMLGAPSFAAPWQESGSTEGGSGEEAGAADEEEEDKDAVERWFALLNGEVHTGTGAVLRGATILARNGKITEIGFDVFVPAEAKTLDVRGMRVYPGIVAVSSQGLLGSSSSDLEDTIDPFNSRMTLGLAAGITSTGLSSSAAKLKRFSVDGVLLRDKIYTSLSWSNRNPSGKRSLREKLAGASAYLRKYRAWEEKVKEDKELKEPSKKGVDTAVLSVLKGETTAKFVANDRDDLLGIAQIAREYGFRPVIQGCIEGWTVADELGRAGAFAIVTPRDRRAKDEQLTSAGGSSIENAAILHRSGVQVAVTPATESVDLGGIVGRDIQAITIEAGFAIRGGLPEDAALASITTVPARILGVSHRVGTLEVGKDCDAIVTDGDLLHYRTFVQYAVVDGKLAYDKEKELFFAHIRPRPAPPEAEKKLDKGETAEEAKPAQAEEDPKDAEKEKDESANGKDEKKEEDKEKEKDEKVGDENGEQDAEEPPDDGS